MAETINHGRIGYCIYCGTTGPDLSREHVVPLSLGGNHVISRASCPECRDITRDFEHTCARTIFGPFRVRGDFPTRHPEERPGTLTLRLIEKNGSTRDVELTPDQHPATLMMPVLHTPTLLLQPDEPIPEGYSMWVALPDPAVLDLVQRYGASAMRLGSFEFRSFYRLLAKVSHVAAYAQWMDPVWTDLFEPMLPDLIRGKSDEYRSVIGGIFERFNKPDEDGMAFPSFFESVDRGCFRYLVAQIRFFADQGTPIYRVVVGRRRIIQHLDDKRTTVE